MEAEKNPERNPKYTFASETALVVTKQSFTGITVKNKMVLHILHNDQVTGKYIFIL